MFSKKIKVLILIMFSALFSFTHSQTIDWQKTIGGSDEDFSRDVQNTSDGNYIVCGFAKSNDGDVTQNLGNRDAWVVKLSPTGDIIWQKTFGGSDEDAFYSIKETNDGGFITVGYTVSNNGDVTGNHGNGDIWLVKLTSTGDITWQKTLGGTGYDDCNNIQLTNDGNYIIGGYTFSNNGDVIGQHGFGDYWIVKIDNNGAIIWQKALGGSVDDKCNSVKQNIDGSYIVCGYVRSTDGDITEVHGGDDAWLVKLSSTGDIIWQKTFGGSLAEHFFSVEETTDGGYIAAGFSASSDGDTTINFGGLDYWIVKINAVGDIIWQKSYGGSGTDIVSSLKIVDNEYLLTGYSNSTNGDVTGNNGDYDFWIIKTANTGTLIWQKSLGGSLFDSCAGIVLTTDGGYIISGSSYSTDGDVTNNHGIRDAWVVKLTNESLANTSFLGDNTTLFPNPTKEKITLKLEYFTPSQEIIITDIQGKIIKNQMIEGLTTTINTSSFEKGIYFLTLFSDGNKTTKKFIVE